MNHVKLLTRLRQRVDLDEPGHGQGLHGQGVGDGVGRRHAQDGIVVEGLII